MKLSRNVHVDAGGNGLTVGVDAEVVIADTRYSNRVVVHAGHDDYGGLTRCLRQQTATLDVVTARVFARIDGNDPVLEGQDTPRSARGLGSVADHVAVGVHIKGEAGGCSAEPHVVALRVGNGHNRLCPRRLGRQADHVVATLVGGRIDRDTRVEERQGTAGRRHGGRTTANDVAAGIDVEGDCRAEAREPKIVGSHIGNHD